MLSNSSKSPTFEKYFECIKNIKHLKAFTKLRIFDHNLMINTKYERSEKLKTITEGVPNFEEMSHSKKKFIFLMTQVNEKILNLIASGTHNWFKIRNTPIVRI